MTPRKRRASQSFEPDELSSQRRVTRSRRLTRAHDTAHGNAEVLPDGILNPPLWVDNAFAFNGTGSKTELGAFVDVNMPFDLQNQQGLDGLYGVSAAPMAPPAANVALPPLTIGGRSLSELGIEPSEWPNDQDAVTCHRALALEIEFQKSNPPAIPPSEVEHAPPPKKHGKGYIPVPEPVGQVENLETAHGEPPRQLARFQNNDVGLDKTKENRQRNNEAARKSRHVRDETITNLRRLYTETLAKLYYHRLVAIYQGQDPDIWDKLPEEVRNDLVQTGRRNAEILEEDRKKKKRQADARARSARNEAAKERALLAASAGVAFDHEPYQQEAYEQVQGPFEDGGYLEVNPAENEGDDYLGQGYYGLDFNGGYE
ncbi:hypothetical protein HIM_02694 [Hirsutella minnesotensis 3608]|nr:hypothetical protein HIM_02694 [Hirsutella minnesotensis 3608]